MKEIWKPVSGYSESYEVSNLGKVRSIDRKLKNSLGVYRTYKGVILKPNTHPEGYKMVALYKEGRGRTFRVHRLVLESFLGSSDLVINHINNDRGDNRLINLEYCTQSHNILHGYSRGNISAKGESNGRAKLTEVVVLNIWEELQKGRHPKEIAPKYLVSISAIKNIKNGYAWAYLTGIENKKYRTRRRNVKKKTN